MTIRTNFHGFRDIERFVHNSADVLRVVLLGDSFVEAIQVSFEKTAGHLLEQKLNGTSANPGRTAGFEVLNFGI